MAVTYDCQCSCAHCSAQTYQDHVAHSHDVLTLSELQDAVQQAVGLGTTCVILTGGEPLLLQGLTDLIQSVPQDQCICTVFTNGEYLSEETVAELQRAGTFGVFVSLDYADAERHNQHRRRPGLFDRAVAGIRRCQEAQLLTGISTFATPQRLQNGDLNTLMELARELNVLEVFLFDAIATGRLRGHYECMLADADAAQVVEFRHQYNSSAEYPRIIHQTMFTSIAYPCAAEGCPAAVAQMHLRANGDVTPCDFTPFSFGNIRQEPLGQIWQNMSHSTIFSHGSSRCRLAEPAYWDALASLAEPRE